MEYTNIKKHIESILNRNLRKNDNDWLPTAENASFVIYNEAWCTTVSIDIVSFKKLSKYYKRWALIKIMQSFTSTIIKIGKEMDEFISCYVNGDEVILNFNSNTRDRIKNIYDCAIEINSAINYLLKDLLIENQYEEELKAGIGIWISNNNSLVKYGEKGSKKESFHTIVGDSINYATKLSKIANRNGEDQIFMNYVFFNNLYDYIDGEEKRWIKKTIHTENDQVIYSCSVQYDGY